ncbi:hypothetical protein OH76DRAFT_1397252 [Lentinus brumalis]|uniref:Uncharacterized protein n=1 Tax=Lentinus brumalis TaxID=2498619 RepID=A0A371DR19_9APHY|nr:hypothetical protein OH76DRAFT_1397252 [Polyporus brumalis]
MTIGLKTLTYVMSTVKLLAEHDFRIDVPTNPTGLDLFFVADFLAGWGSMCYLAVLNREDGIRSHKPTPHILAEFFGSISSRTLLLWPCLAHVRGFSWKSPAKYTTRLEGLFDYLVTSTPVRKHSSTVSTATSSTCSVSVNAAGGPSSLSAGLLWCTTRFSSALWSCAAASKTRYLSASQASGPRPPHSRIHPPFRAAAAIPTSLPPISISR